MLEQKMPPLIDGMYRVGNLPRTKPSPREPASTSRSSTPVSGSDRRLYAMANDRKVLSNFDAALTAQRTSAQPTPEPTMRSEPERVAPKRAEDPSDQKFYNMAADRENKANAFDARAVQLNEDADALGTASPYASQAMRDEAKGLQREANALRRTHVSGQGDPRGTGTSEIRRPFEVQGEDQTDIGRAVIERALQDTADDGQIQRDEFEVVELENGKYIVVLPGVIDLSDKVKFKSSFPFVERPHIGWDPHSRSVRDTEMAAFASSTSTGIEDNRYAQMVRDYMIQHVPQGADVMFVGHSFGADTALDLASDPTFNNRETGFNVTHVTAAAYYSQPQLRHVQNDTEVLVLQNRNDVPVIFEAEGYATGRGARLAYDTAEEANAIRQSVTNAGTGFASDVAGEGARYVNETLGEVPEVVNETAAASRDIAEGGREAGGGAFGFVKTGASWLGNSTWNSLRTAGETGASLAQGDLAGAGRAVISGHAEQNEIDTNAGAGFRESGSRIVDGVSQQAGAVGGWTSDQATRFYDRAYAAPREHAGHVANSALDHGGDVFNSVLEHGGNVASDIGDRDIYDIPTLPVAGSNPELPFLSNPGENQIVSRFNGGFEGAGHHQNNYIEYINNESVGDPIQAYFASVADAGYGDVGTSRAVDVSVPED